MRGSVTFMRAFLIFVAALVLPLGIVMPAGAAMAEVARPNSVVSPEAASGTIPSRAAALAARRGFVRNRLLEAEQSAGRAEAAKFTREWKAMSPGQRRAMSVRARSAASRKTAASRALTDPAPHENATAATAATNSAVIYDLYVTGPTGELYDYYSDGGFAGQGADITPGEQLTAYAEVQSSSSSSSEEVTVPFTGACGNDDAGPQQALGSATVDAPENGGGSLATVSVSFTVPTSCPYAYDYGFPNYWLSAFSDTTEDAGIALEFDWLDGFPSAELTACTCSADSAAPGSEAADAADPVDTVSGAYAGSATDASLKSQGYPLTVARSYSSADTSPGPLGPGWSVPWNASLSIDSSSGNATFTAENGDQYVYTPDGYDDGGFVPPLGARSVLEEVTDSSGNVTGYTLTDLPGHSVLTFNAAGQLESEADSTGRGQSFAYNSSGEVSSITDAAGHQVTLTYSGSLLSQTALPDGQDVGYAYSSSGQLTSVTDPGGGQWQYTYNPAGLLSTVEDPDQHVTLQNTYNSSGQVTQQKDGDGNVTGFSYTTTSGGLSETDVTAPDGGITTYLYDAGMLMEKIGPVGNAATTFNYNNFGEPTNVTDPLGRVTSYDYDDTGDLTTETDNLGHSQSWTYDDSGNALTYEDADTNTATYTYNSTDEVLTATTQDGQETQYTYNSDGSLATEISARGYTTTYSYYSDGMLKSATTPDSDTTTYTYDSMGSPSTVKDPMARVTAYGYDAAEQVTSVTTAAGETNYGHDADGNLTSREDPDQNTWTYAYNADSGLAKATDPLGNSDTYGYDGDGNQTSFTDARGITTTTAYYLDDRPEKITYSDSTPSVSYQYDADGEATSVADSTGTQSLSYDGDGGLTAEGGFSYTYDPAGNLSSRKYPDGTTTSYGYTGEEQVSSMTVGSAQTTYSYDADGNLVSTVEPDGVTESRTYDNADQLTGVTASSSASKLDSYGLTLNADGQPTAVAVIQDGTAEPDRNFGYDSPGRLTAECDSDSGLTACTAADETSYSYDAAGNLTSSDSNGATTTNNYNADEERTSSVTGSATTSYGYDADGNQTSAGSTSYTYNAAGELTGADTSAGNYAYSYDGSGNLATTSLNGAEQSATAWDLNNPLPQLAEQTSPTGSVTSEYAWNPDGALSTQTQGGAAGTGTSYYATTDWEGSVTGLVNANGTQVSSTTYTAYGTPDTTGTVTSSIGYVGSYTLPGAGLDDMRARDYSPATAQFTSADPLATVTGQPYAYVGGNPLGATDPAGLCGGWCWAAVGAAVVGTAACIVVEPCGIAEGGLAVSLGGTAVATSGITFVGGGTLVGGGIVGGLIGGGAYAVSSGGSSGSSDNGDEACDNGNFENTNFSLEEIAEFARGHAGDDNPAMGRPSLSQVEDTLQNGAKSPGGGNSIRFDYKGVRVIVNLDNPLRSTTYYPGR